MHVYLQWIDININILTLNKPERKRERDRDRIAKEKVDEMKYKRTKRDSTKSARVQDLFAEYNEWVCSTYRYIYNVLMCVCVLAMYGYCTLGLCVYHHYFPKLPSIPFICLFILLFSHLATHSICVLVINFLNHISRHGLTSSCYFPHPRFMVFFGV